MTEILLHFELKRNRWNPLSTLFKHSQARNDQEMMNDAESHLSNSNSKCDTNTKEQKKVPQTQRN